MYWPPPTAKSCGPLPFPLEDGVVGLDALEPEENVCVPALVSVVDWVRPQARAGSPAGKRLIALTASASCVSAVASSAKVRLVLSLHERLTLCTSVGAAVGTPKTSAVSGWHNAEKGTLQEALHCS